MSMSILLPTLTRSTRTTLPTFLIPFLNSNSNSNQSITTILPLTSSSTSSSSSSLLLSTLSLPSSLTSLFPDSLSSLRELLPPWVLAVPKSKTSHSRKSMRSANKGLKEQQNIVACPSCGTPKRAHHLCHDCHVDHRREYHAKAKEELQAGRKELVV